MAASSGPPNNILTHVPLQLQRLVRLIIRAFYQPEHYIVMDILARYPCVKDCDLHELLKIDPKKLRVILNNLKKDKLIKSVSRMEPVKDGGENGEKKSVLSNYYYINYKVFVNVVKYKLDKMRERIQLEERTVSNRTSYVCPNCQNTYTDLDVDRLLDPMEGILRCIMCKSPLDEETPSGPSMDARSTLSKLNEQLRPILDILREVENISLAENVLDPEPQSIQSIIDENKFEKGKAQQNKEIWSSGHIDDIYGDQTFTINIGSESDLKQKAARKDAPQWMKESTVYTADSTEGGEDRKDTMVTNTSARNVVPGDEIMKLLASEEGSRSKREKSTGDDDDDTSSEGEGSDTSSSGEEEMEEDENTKSLSTSMSLQSHTSLAVSSNEEDDSEDEEDEDEMTMKVGDKVYELGDITSDIIAGMTPTEKQKYTELYQQAYNNFF